MHNNYFDPVTKYIQQVLFPVLENGDLVFEKAPLLQICVRASHSIKSCQ